MPATPRPRRSVLYMPGANRRALEKGRSLPTDAIIMDLEDAVTPDAKDEARDNILEALQTGGYGARELIVRVNDLSSAWGRADLAAMAGADADAILIPKVESAGDVDAALEVLDANNAPAALGVWCMMETPLAILDAKAIAGASPRLAALVMGTSDLAKDLGAAHTPDRAPLLTALSLCILAARAHGLAVLDGVQLDLADDEGFAAACRQGRDLGFDGKTLIHPKTLAAANRVYSPSEDDLAWARRIIAAHAAAEADGKGVVLVDGKLIENLHVDAAKRLTAQAEMIAAGAAASI
jgi:citrate lyase subunit beta/citryl-CoA lyase